MSLNSSFRVVLVGGGIVAAGFMGCGDDENDTPNSIQEGIEQGVDEAEKGIEEGRDEVEKGRAAAREGRLLDHDDVAARIDRRYRG